MMKATYTKRGCSNHLILRTMLGESTMNVSTSKIHLIVENFSGIVELLSFEKKARNIYGMETRLVDAEEAGGINSEHCVLMVTEGNSAKSFASFSQQGDDTVVHFTIKIMADKVKSFSELTGAQLLQKFKLTTRISTNNMHLLDADGQVQHYANIEEIMKVFFEERLRSFRDRGEHTIRNHRLHISILQNKVRYLKPMWDKGIEAAHKYPNDSAPDKMVEELHSKEFTRMKGKSPESDVVDGEVATFDDYEYLLSLPYHTITEKTVEEMETEIVEKQQKLAELQASTPTEKWQQELGRLRTELVKIEAYAVRIEVAEIDNSDDI